MTRPREQGGLRGRTIALSETRELDRLAEMLGEAGATALRCPLVAIRDAPDPGPVEGWVRTLVAGELDDLVFLTGEGLRRLLATAERLGVRAEAIEALRRARKVTRGPKPARALHEIGLASDLAAPVPTSAGVMEALGAWELAGRRVGVQLYGEEPNRPLVQYLESRGAKVLTVAPYVYASASDEAAVSALVEAIAEGSVDAIAFTSASQVDRLWQVASGGAAGSPGERRLVAALGRIRVAAIGPIAVESLEARRVRVDVVPEKGFVMRRLVDALVEALGPRE
jgi:uroporphyrinogen-III synthase